MAESLRVHRGAWYGSLALHVLFALVFLVGVEALKPMPETGSPARVIQANLITDRAIGTLVADLETDTAIAPEVFEPAKPEFESEPELEPALIPEPEPFTPDLAEAQRLAAELITQEAAQREFQEQKRAAQRLAAEQEAERQRRAEAEARAQAEEQARRQVERERQHAEAERLAQERAEAERQRAAQEARRLAAERERQRRQEAERRAAEAAQLAAELERAHQQQLAEEAAQLVKDEEQRLAEDLLQEQLLAEAAQLRTEERIKKPKVRGNQGAITETTREYQNMIGEYVEQYWIRPAELNQEIQYEVIVLVRLTQSGDLIDAKIIQSNGTHLFEQSVLAAINKAGRFPVPDGPEFENFRQFKFKFKPRR
ncbi:colicin import membrane protein [Allochromatium warmingii]|uniref:Colicin import membrane protein n=1 Tax=Allochromatium warmingii TaxID=61595 RepID=A0A1H3GDS1_ALLWA|nr:cell envelope integrity protein TolA [Allochromatium warmingii]SDY01421.1 colicin import membrane protein [Allochromatium warmingii]